MSAPDRSGALADRIASNRLRFDALLDDATAHLARGRPEEAAATAQLAGALAWHNPIGLFASPRLEHLLHEIASQSAPAPRRRRPTTGRQHVLHVLTVGQQVGGHTRLAWRWMTNDAGRVHSVAVTRQGREPVPRSLEAAAEARGGRAHRVDRGSSRLVQRAEALATLAADADLVVLHIHPFDVVPLIALFGLDAAGERPTTLLVNHADHVFWVGVSAADLVVHLRASGVRLSTDRRGLPQDRAHILPLPLGSPPAADGRREARAALGIARDEVLAVSVASGYKYVQSSDRGLLPLLEASVAQASRLRVMVIGPGRRSDWTHAAQRTNGRIRSLDVTPDVGAVLAAADIYIDSHPFSSLTSMLEAGLRGIPLLTLAGPSSELEVLGFDDPALDGERIRCANGPDFVRALGELVADLRLRQERGDRIRQAITEHHAEPGWTAHLEEAYAHAHRLHVTRRPGHPGALADPDSTIGELDRSLVRLLDAQQADAPPGVRGHLRLAPFGIRFREWRTSLGSERPLSVLVLLPEAALFMLRRLSQRIGASRRRFRGRARSGERVD